MYPIPSPSLVSLVLPSFASPLDANFFLNRPLPAHLISPCWPYYGGRLVDWAATHSGQSLVRQQIWLTEYWSILTELSSGNFNYFFCVGWEEPRRVFSSLSRGPRTPRPRGSPSPPTWTHLDFPHVVQSIFATCLTRNTIVVKMGTPTREYSTVGLSIQPRMAIIIHYSTAVGQ